MAICRQIWSYRNNTIYGGMKKDHMHARMVVIDALQHVDRLVIPRSHSSKYGIDSLKVLGIIPKTPKAKRLTMCAWTPPKEGAYALNVDGSCRGNQMAIGGVIRDHEGNLVCAYAGPKGMGTSFQGEIHALALGAELIEELQKQPTTAFTDSMSLAKSIGAICPHWSLFRVWNSMTNHLRFIPVVHCFREANSVADALSKLGHNLPRLQYYFDVNELPKPIQRLLWLDRTGHYFSRLR